MKICLKILTFVFAICVCTICVQSVYASEYYVDSSAGSGDGSAVSPFSSINAAIAAAQPGDTVIVRPGIYYETVTIDKCGTKDKPITLRAESNGLYDTLITAAQKDVRENKVRWTLLDGTDDVYYISCERDVGSMLCNSLMMARVQTLEQLKTRSKNGEFNNFPTLGYYYDTTDKKLYIRLSSEYCESLDPNKNKICVGGEYVSEVETSNGNQPCFRRNGIKKNSNCYNMSVWTEKESYINIEGFTFETPGVAALYIRGSQVNVRNCWFRGCKIGVMGSSTYMYDEFCTNDVTVQYCDYTQYPFYTDIFKNVATMTPERRALEKSDYYYWPHKTMDYATFFDGEAMGLIYGAAYRWDISYNNMYDVFEAFPNSWMLIHWVKYGTSNYSICGGDHKIHDNRIAYCVDNVIELESHCSGVDFYRNECIDSMNAISWQPMDGLPYPKNAYIHNNLFFESDEYTKAFDCDYSNGMGMVGTVPDVFKLGATKSNWKKAWMVDAGHYLDDATDKVQRRLIVDDKGLNIYNNTIVTPGQYTMTSLGVWDADADYNVGVRFANNIFYNYMQPEVQRRRLFIMPGSFFGEGYGFEYDTNIFVPSNPDDAQFKEDSLCFANGYKYKSFDEAGLKLIDGDEYNSIEISDKSSVATAKGTQMDFTQDDTTYIGALRYGEKWHIHYGVYKYGDVNLDGTVDINDISEMSVYIESNQVDYDGRYDLNFDGKCNADDVVILVELISGGVQ